MNNKVSALATHLHLSRFHRLALVCAALLAAAPAPVRAQQSEIDALASRLAEQIAKPHLNRVVVVDLVSPGDKSRQLGVQLADQIAAALVKVDNDLEIVERARLKRELEERKITALDLFDPETARFLGKSFGAQVVVTGTFGPAENAVGILLGVYKVTGRIEMFAQIDGKIPMTKEMDALLREPPQFPPLDGIYKPGQGGVGLPMCVYCPNPNYSEEDRSGGVEGTVVLEVIITPEGRATGITIKKSRGPALDQRAVEAVRTWKFKPAIGPSGKPVPVRTSIEITFRLLKR